MNFFKRNSGRDCGTTYCPPSIAPTQYDPGTVDPPITDVKTTIFPYVAKHVHPSHTTNVNKQITTHQHYFPHTESVVNECYEQHVMCGTPYIPCCPPYARPFHF